jgi:hypothetical protein
MQASYFPLSDLSPGAFYERVLAVAGQVHAFRSADFPGPPFFLFDLTLDSGKTVSVQGGPEKVIMRLERGRPGIISRWGTGSSDPSKAVSEIQVSPRHLSAMPLYEGERVMVAGLWDGERLIADRVDVLRAGEMQTWYHRSLVAEDELNGRTANLFRGLALYVPVLGKQVPDLAPEVPAKVVAAYKKRTIILKGELEIEKDWQFREAEVYVHGLQGYRRLYPADDTSPVIPRSFWVLEELMLKEGLFR